VVALRCLIVGNNAHVLAAARSLLAREGMVVGVASSSAEALARAEEFHPDVIFVDIELGQDCGLDLARQLPAAPGAQHSSVILCTANSAQDFAELIAELKAGARRQEADARRQEAGLAAELGRLLLRTQDLFSTRAEPQPADTEERIQKFTELVVTAIADTESRDELRLLAEQQAALRRVATLVARGVSPSQLFAVVAEQMGQVLDAEFVEIIRYGTDRAYTVVGTWTRSKPTLSRPLGSHWLITPGIVPEVLLRTGSPARIDFYRDGYGDGEVSVWQREHGITSAVGCPIVVEGRQWGAMLAFSTGTGSQPADTEERMQEFTELVATAIANTESRTELISSRARVVAAADETRRRIGRDLHDGTQQRLISLALDLRAAEAVTPPELDELRARLAHTSRGLAEAVIELQEISRGIHPAILSSGGIGPALETLARRSAVPAELTVSVSQGRLAERVEVAAYYIVSEALTNAAKHAHASVVHINLNVQDAVLRLWVRDDGDGGADPGQGSGLTGLRDRVEALNGTIEISSPVGDGTSLTVTIPNHNALLEAHQPAGSRAHRPGRSAVLGVHVAVLEQAVPFHHGVQRGDPVLVVLPAAPCVARGVLPGADGRDELPLKVLPRVVAELRQRHGQPECPPLPLRVEPRLMGVGDAGGVEGDPAVLAVADPGDVDRHGTGVPSSLAVLRRAGRPARRRSWIRW
jgi:signal transduction histidine kinase